MYKNSQLTVLTVSEARQNLPGLLQKIAAGGKPVALGRRGKPEVVMMSLAQYEAIFSPTSFDAEAVCLEIDGGEEALEEHVQWARSRFSQSIEKRVRHHGKKR